MQNEIDYIALGNRIRIMRDKAHLTQAQLAEACDLSTSHIGHIERGNRILSVDVLFKISVALHVSLDYLLFDSVPTNPAVFTNIISLIEKKNNRQVRTFLTAVRALADKIDEL